MQNHVQHREQMSRHDGTRRKMREERGRRGFPIRVINHCKGADAFPDDVVCRILGGALD
jgi:hypothetical protein